MPKNKRTLNDLYREWCVEPEAKDSNKSTYAILALGITAATWPVSGMVIGGAAGAAAAGYGTYKIGKGALGLAGKILTGTGSLLGSVGSLFKKSPPPPPPPPRPLTPEEIFQRELDMIENLPENVGLDYKEALCVEAAERFLKRMEGS